MVFPIKAESVVYIIYQIFVLVFIVVRYINISISFLHAEVPGSIPGPREIFVRPTFILLRGYLKKLVLHS